MSLPVSIATLVVRWQPVVNRSHIVVYHKKAGNLILAVSITLLRPHNGQPQRGHNMNKSAARWKCSNVLQVFVPARLSRKVNPQHMAFRRLAHVL